jgi:DNA-binding response OmpR family regulator
MVSGNGKPCTDRQVLVVEDDPEINRLVGAYVEFAGFQYIAALDGGEALAQIREQHPCAIVLDLMLPDVSGWEVCRRVKTASETNHIPVIILTALDNDDSRQEGVRCGAAEYLTKPFDPDRLLQSLLKHARDRSSNGDRGE